MGVSHCVCSRRWPSRRKSTHLEDHGISSLVPQCRPCGCTHARESGLQESVRLSPIYLHGLARAAPMDRLHVCQLCLATKCKFSCCYYIVSHAYGMVRTKSLQMIHPQKVPCIVALFSGAIKQLFPLQREMSSTTPSIYPLATHTI